MSRIRFAAAGVVGTLLILLQAGVAAAQVTTTISPPTSSYSHYNTPYVLAVEVAFCSMGSPLTSEREITFNGSSVIGSFTLAATSWKGCTGGSYARYTGTVELQPGSNNTVWAYAYNQLDQWGQATATYTFTQTAPPVTSVVVTRNGPATIGVGQHSDFTARTYGPGGIELFDKTVTWSGSHVSVATATTSPSSGTATGTSAGSGWVQASSGGVSSSQEPITVVNPTYAVTASSNRPTTITLSPGATSTGTTTYTIQNTSTYTSQSSTFSLSATPTGVIGTCSVSPSAVTLSAGQTSGSVSVSCPVGATTTSSSPTVTFTAQTSSPASFSQSHVTTFNVSPSIAFALTMPNGSSKTEPAQTTSGSTVFRIHNNSVNAGGASTIDFVASCSGVLGCSNPASVSVAEGSYVDVTVPYSVALAGQNGAVSLTAQRSGQHAGQAAFTVNTTPHYGVTVSGPTVNLAAGATSDSTTYTITNTSTNSMPSANMARTFTITRSCSAPLLASCTGVTSIALRDGASGWVATNYNVTANGSNATAQLTASSSPSFSHSATTSVTIAPLYAVSVAPTAGATRNLAARTRVDTALFTIINNSQNQPSMPQFTLQGLCTGMAGNCFAEPAAISMSQGASATIKVISDISITGTAGTAALTATHGSISPVTGTQNLTITPYYAAEITQAASSTTLPERTPSDSATYTVRNLSENAASVAITLSSGCGGVTSSCQSPTPSSVTIGYNQTASATINYDVSRFGTTGSVTLSGTGASGALNASATRTVNTIASPSISVVAPATDAAITGNSRTFNVQLWNSSWNTSEVISATLDGGACSNTVVGACTMPAATSVALAQDAYSSSVPFSYSALKNGSDGISFSAAAAAHVDVYGHSVAVTVTNSGPLTTIAKGVNPGTVIDRGRCVTAAVGANAAYECGDLRVVHPLPATRTMERAHVPALVYNSRHATGGTLIIAEVIYTGSTTPTGIEAMVQVGTHQAPTRTFPWNPACAGQPCRIVIPVSTSLSTGAYEYTVQTRAVNGAAVLHTSNTVTDTVIVVNRSQSPFGAGWWLQGLEELRFTSDSQVLWVGGDGSARTYRHTGSPNVYTVQPGYDRPDTLLRVGAKWRRQLGDSSYVQFNEFGKHELTRNAQRWVTSFAYTTATVDAVLQSVSLPIPSSSSATRAYTFGYGSVGSLPVLNSVTAPNAGAIARAVTTHRTGFQIDSLRDPDGIATGFAYVGGRLTTRRNRLTDLVSFAYDDAGGLTQSTVDMSRTGGLPPIMSFRPAETRGAEAANTQPVPLSQVYTWIDGLRTDVADTMMAFVNRWGAPDSLRNPLDEITRVRRDNPAFPAAVTSATTPAGLERRAWFNHRALIDSVKEINPLGDGRDAVTRYAWHGVWNRITSVTSPQNEVRQIQYNAGVAVPTWVQRGTSSSRRVNLYYNGDWQVGFIRFPGDTARQKIGYDSRGNIGRVTSPMRLITLLYKDAVGRDTLVITPKSAASALTDGAVIDSGTRIRTTYDVMGRADSTRTMGKANPYAPQQELITKSIYDALGNLVRFERSSVPSLPGIGTIVTEWEYDAAGRQVVAIAPDGRADSMSYDRAGNVRLHKTRRGQTISMTYDALNRVLTRTVPVVTYAARNEGLALTLLEGGDDGFVTYPWFPTDPDSGLTIAQDIESFQYSVHGLVRAKNRDALVRRSYYPNGLLRGDTLSIGRIAVPSDTTTHRYGLIHRYDLDGRRITLKHPVQLVPSARDSVRFSYNSVGELSTVTDLLGNLFSFIYDGRGDQIRTQMPGGMRDSSVYDADSRLVRSIVYNGSSSTMKYPDPIIRDQTMAMDAVGRVLSYIDAQGPRVSVQAEYSGLGHLVRRERHAPVESDFGNHADVTSFEQFGLDGLGNRFASFQSSTFVGQFQTLVDSSTSSAGYEVGGRQRTSATSSRYDTLQYDVAGNLEFSTSKRFLGHYPQLEDRALFYAADGRLRYAEYRALTTDAGHPTGQKWHMSFEEYRYDALGRRVLVYNRARCWRTPKPAACDKGWARRTIWDGDAELYEIQMPETHLENDTDTLPTQLMFDPSIGYKDLSPKYGRVAYTYGHALDQPLSMTRINYSDNTVVNGMQQNLAPHAQYPAFTVAPHWDWRGGAELGTVDDGGALKCLASNRCAWIQWPQQSFAYVRSINDTATGWFGTLQTDKRDASGLYYRRNRYLDPMTGRFTQEDPIGLAGGMNLYGFANGDPVNYSDPFGLKAYLNCRPVKYFQDYGHCAIRVYNSAAGLDIVVELNQDDDGRNQIHWTSPGRGFLAYNIHGWTEIEAPQGMDESDFDRAILNAALQVGGELAGKNYRPTGDRNSNRYVNEVIRRAGGSVPGGPAKRFPHGAPGLCGGIIRTGKEDCKSNSPTYPGGRE